MFDLEDIASLHIEDAFRNSYEYEGIQVPRVTAIISKMIEEEGIKQWANSLGFHHQSYSRVLKDLAILGTLTHNAISTYIMGNPIPSDAPQYPMDSFRLWWSTILRSGGQVLGSEVPVVCDLYGGTYDLLLKIKKKRYLVDFKTSNHVTYKYWLQLAAYTRVLRQQGVNINGLMILQLCKTDIAFREYVLDFSNQSHKEYFDICERTFMALLYSYYHITYLERRFKNEWGSIKPQVLPRRVESNDLSEGDA